MAWPILIRNLFAGPSAAAVTSTAVVAMQEAFPYGGMSVDPDLEHTPEQMGSRYVRRLTQSNRDLPPITHERMLALAYGMYDANPMARRILRLTRAMVVGDGVTVTAGGDDDTYRQAMQEVIDRFWNDAVNRLDLKLPEKVLQLGLAGSQCWPTFINDVDGHVRLGYIDPADIATVITHPENAELPIAVQMKAPVSGTRRIYKVIAEDDDPNSATYGRLIGARPGETLNLRTGVGLETQITAGQTLAQPSLGLDDDQAVPYVGSCFFFAINKVSNAKLGRSDLLSLFDWIDAVDQSLFNGVDRSVMLKNFIWDVTVDSSDDVVQDYAKRFGSTAPPPGTVRVHNKNVEWNAVTPDLKSSDSKEEVDLLVSYIATGSGFPKLWLNGTMDINRASAIELSEPAFKELAERQNYVKYMVTEVVRFVLDQAALHGTIAPLPKEDGSIRPAEWPFAVNAPEIRNKDVRNLGQTFAPVVAALSKALTDGAIDIDIYQEAMVMLLGMLGVEINLEDLRNRMDATATERAQQPPPQNANGKDGMKTEDMLATVLAGLNGNGADVGGQSMSGR